MPWDDWQSSESPHAVHTSGLWGQEGWIVPRVEADERSTDTSSTSESNTFFSLWPPILLILYFSYCYWAQGDKNSAGNSEHKKGGMASIFLWKNPFALLSHIKMYHYAVFWIRNQWAEMGPRSKMVGKQVERRRKDPIKSAILRKKESGSLPSAMHACI